MLYGLADAQIDAQNRATNDIGAIKATYNSIKASGGLTVTVIQNTIAQIQSVIDNYNAQWGGTTRGRAGGQTLQSFVQSAMMPEFNADMNALPAPSPYSGSGTTGPVTDLNQTPVLQPYTPGGSSTNIVIGGGSSQTPGNIGPSQTPGPPAGVDVSQPGIEPAPWYMSPTVWLMAGLVVLPMLIGKSDNK